MTKTRWIRSDSTFLEDLKRGEKMIRDMSRGKLRVEPPVIVSPDIAEKLIKETAERKYNDNK